MASGPVDIGGELRKVIAGLCEREINPRDVSAPHRIREDLGFDSVTVMDLMIELENRFAVYFDPYEHDLAQIFSTVGSIELFLKENATTGAIPPGK